MLTRFAIITAALTALGACATIQPEPCTTEWAEYKTEKVLGQFARSNYREVRRLKSFAETLEDGNIGPLTALKIPAMIEDFKELAASFEGEVLPELNAALDQCGDVQTLIPAFTAFLSREGVGEDVLEWVELLGAFAVES